LNLYIFSRTNLERGLEATQGVETTPLQKLPMQTEFSRIEKKYGKPKFLRMSFSLSLREFTNLKESMEDGRNSDVTLFIFKGDKLIVNSKPWYPPGLYRAPSGGVRPGESLEEVALREAYEETGVRIKLQRYVLRIKVTFSHKKKDIVWTSHIFTARYLSGKIEPIDTTEIKEAKLLSLEELSFLKALLLKTGSGGLAYRAALTERAIEEIKKKM
jgi:ADP-ribose pyrophosphatase YjhB (NUDIX family)